MSKSNLNLIVQRNITTLTFDCYGTLVDWERGVATAVREILGRRNVSVSEDNLIRAFLTADADFIAKN
jgi:2-haloacid dehalogenase